MKNNKTKALKEMLSINKKVLAGLHYIKGFDFEKPFDIISGDGNFTMNSIKKQYKEHDIDITGTTAILLMLKKQDYWSNKRFYVVEIQFFACFCICERGLYEFNLQHFYGVGDFETARKHNTDKYYVVIQKKEYLTKAYTEKKVDYSERLEAVGKYTKWSTQNGTKGGFQVVILSKVIRHFILMKNLKLLLKIRLINRDIGFLYLSRN